MLKASVSRWWSLNFSIAFWTPHLFGNFQIILTYAVSKKKEYELANYRWGGPYVVAGFKMHFHFSTRWHSKLKAVYYITFLDTLQNYNWEPVFSCQTALAIEDQEYVWLSPLLEWCGGLFFFLELSTLFLLMVSGLYKAVCKRSSQQKCKSRSSVTTTTTTCW